MELNAINPLLLPQREVRRTEALESTLAGRPSSRGPTRARAADKESSASFSQMLDELVPKNLDGKVSSEAFSRTPGREKIIAHIGDNKDRQKMFEAARQFENFFMEKMFREMKKNMGKNDIIHGGSAEDIFQDMLLTERVNKMTSNSTMGLAEQIYTQMQRTAK